MADQNIRMPGPFGGLMRYDEEYTSRFMISPAQVVVFVVLLVVFVIGLKLFL
ncbi:MAG TPA: preprotein translocase subunit Sec61beta [Candidatus Nanoarchaeia archaeon]|nr:preprotein translocase subunit Sec61beta [Candidatus Nanoarchaeia archaeon]